jgi:uncharacterized protein (TIGR02598 family)
MKNKRNSKSDLRKGFTLVEVTLATSILALAITSILGLIPFSLSNSREAGETMTESIIHQTLLGRMSVAKWSGVDGQDLLSQVFNGHQYFFDDQGVEVLLSGNQGAGRITYMAQIRIHPRDVKLPAADVGSGETSQNDPYLRRVTVLIAPASGTGLNWNAMPNYLLRKRSALLVNSEI